MVPVVPIETVVMVPCILTDIPWQLLDACGFKRDAIGAVGVVYMPRGYEDACRTDSENSFIEEGLAVLGWRVVPTRQEVLGSLALTTCPAIEQIVIGKPDTLGEAEFNSQLMVVRKKLINSVRSKEGRDDFYLASLSPKRLSIKVWFARQSCATFTLTCRIRFLYLISRYSIADSAQILFLVGRLHSHFACLVTMARSTPYLAIARGCERENQFSSIPHIMEENMIFSQS